MNPLSSLVLFIIGAFAAKDVFASVSQTADEIPSDPEGTINTDLASLLAEADQNFLSMPDPLTSLTDIITGGHMVMELSQNGQNYIKGRESLSLVPYKDIAGKWTIGYGHKILPGESYTQIDAATADAIFLRDVSPSVAAVNSLVTVPLTQNQFDALVSLVFNIGVPAFSTSTLLRKLNSGDYSAAAEQFKVWNKITDPKTGLKIVSNGLVNRRAADLSLFLA